MTELQAFLITSVIVTVAVSFVVTVLVVWYQTSFNPLNLFSSKIDKQVFKQIINVIKWGLTMPLKNWDSKYSVYLYKFEGDFINYSRDGVIEMGPWSKVNGIDMPFNLSQTLIFYYYYKKSRRYIVNLAKKEKRDKALDEVIKNCQRIPILEGAELPTGQLSITECQTVKEVT